MLMHMDMRHSHLRLEGKACVYIVYCTGSGMLTRYPTLNCAISNVLHIHAAKCVHISLHHSQISLIYIHILPVSLYKT